MYFKASLVHVQLLQMQVSAWISQTVCLLQNILAASQATLLQQMQISSMHTSARETKWDTDKRFFIPMIRCLVAASHMLLSNSLPSARPAGQSPMEPNLSNAPAQRVTSDFDIFNSQQHTSSTQRMDLNSPHLF